MPKFKSITIAGEAKDNNAPYEDAYAKNRALSVVHYWLALIEDPARNAGPVREILSDDFKLNFSSGPITDFDGFKAWMAGPASSLAASTHILRDISVTASDDTNLSVEMTFEWAGFTPDGVRLVAETRHRWQLINEVTERFARIAEMNVEVLKPFQPAPAQ